MNSAWGTQPLTAASHAETSTVWNFASYLLRIFGAKCCNQFDQMPWKNRGGKCMIKRKSKKRRKIWNKSPIQ